MEEELVYFGNRAFSQEEIAVLDKAIEATRKANVSYGVYQLLDQWANRRDDCPYIPPYMIDTYLEAKGLKSPDFKVPPRTICGGYEITEKPIKRGEILPSWYTREDGAILYFHR